MNNVNCYMRFPIWMRSHNCSNRLTVSTIIVDIMPEVKGYVYLLEEKEESGDATGFYKVGKAVDIEIRISNLQTGNVRKLRVKRKVEVYNYTAAEKKAHKNLRDYKVNLGGGKEWFQVEESELEMFIGTFKDALEEYKV